MRGRFDGGLYSKRSREGTLVFVIILKWQKRIEMGKKEKKKNNVISFVFTDIPISSVPLALIHFVHADNT